MGQVKYETVGRYNYLVYEVDKEDAVDEISVGMLTNNKIPGLAETVQVQINDRRELKYNITSKINMSSFIDGKINRKKVLGVLNGIVDSLMVVEDYMIDANSIILNPDYIFSNVSTCETILICIPVINSEIPQLSLSELIKGMLFNSTLDQSENVDYFAKLVNFVNTNSTVPLKELKKLLGEIEGKERAVTNNAGLIQNRIKQSVAPEVHSAVPKEINKPEPVVPPIPAPVSERNVVPEIPASTEPEKGKKRFLIPSVKAEEDASEENTKDKKKEKKAGKDVRSLLDIFKSKKNKEEVNIAPADIAIPQVAVPPVSSPKPVDIPIAIIPKTNTGGSETKNNPSSMGVSTATYDTPYDGRTVMISPEQAKAVSNTLAYLIREKTKNRVQISSDVFKIGKDPNYADFCISDNPAVSRSHAQILKKADTYFVIDTNSTNHTFVNGSMIVSNIEKQLNDGDIVEFGNEKFTFHDK